MFKSVKYLNLGHCYLFLKYTVQQLYKSILNKEYLGIIINYLMEIFCITCLK